MNNLKRTLLQTTASLVLIVPAIQAHAVVRCQDAEGNWYIGDTLPPECAQEGYQELNEQGLVVEEKEAALSDEEIAEQKRQQAMEEEKQRMEEQRERKDRILMDTFSTVEDIKLARDGKLAAIETSIGLTQKRNEKLQDELDKLVETAAADERAGKQPSEHVTNDIEALRRQISNNNDFIAEKRQEMEQVREEYAQNVERFKELKGIN